MSDGERLRLNTTELQRGDIVHIHGMRVLLDVDPIRTPGGYYGSGVVGHECFAWVGKVLNPDDADVREIIPRSWIYTDGIGQPRSEPRWNVQGNDFAFWSVERP